jgi:signal transduction histidine kinase/HAMP domain-containing protein
MRQTGSKSSFAPSRGKFLRRLPDFFPGNRISPRDLQPSDRRLKRMKKISQPSFRTRLIHLVLLAVLPALALILYSAGEQRVRDSERAKREALRLARVVATSQKGLIDGTRQLLVALSSLREVRAQEEPACSALFANLLGEYPLYVNLGAANMHGRQYCSGLPMTRQVEIAERGHFRLAIKYKGLAIDNFPTGQIEAKAVLNLGYPIIERDGRVSGVVFAAFDVANLKQIAGNAALPAYASLAIYDRDGTVLARYPDDETSVGEYRPQAGTGKAAAAQEGVTEGSGLDGKKRFYAFAAIGDTPANGQIFLRLGIPADVALADADWLLRRNLAALLLVTALALIAAWYGGDAFVLGPLRILVSTSERLGAGDLAARTGLPHDRNEIGRVAASFDRMAATLETRRDEAVASGQRLGRNLQRLEALHDIEMAITSTLDLHSMLDLLLEKVELVLPGAVTTIRLINKETGTLEPAACRNISESEWRAGNPRPMHGFAKIVLENKIPLTIANLRTDPRSNDHRFAHRWGLVSYLGIPLVAKNQLLGLIAFFTKEEHSFSDEEIEFLTTLAGQSAIAIHNAMLYDETRQSARELSALHALTIAATRSLDLSETLRSAIEKVTEIFHFDATRIFLFDSEMTELRIAAVFEEQPELWTKLGSFQRGQGIVGRAAETGEVFVFEDVRNDPRYLELSHSKILESTSTGFFAVFPVATKLRTWGVAVFVGREARRLQAHETRLLMSMTHQIGIAVENATLYSQTAAKAKELSALYSIAGIAGESLDIDAVLGQTMVKVLAIFDFDAARIYSSDEESGDLRLVAHCGIPEGVQLVSRYGAGEGQLGNVVQTGQAAFVEDMASDPVYDKLAHNKYLLKAGFRSSFLIPLKVRGEGLGVMHFLGRKPYSFSDSEVQLINAIAYHLSVAVGNARLFAQLQKKTIELERASQGKDEFLGVISHELRTPLNVIKGYTEIMMQGILGDVSDEQKRALETISNQAMDLFHMISGVLQVTRIEAGAVQTSARPVDLVGLLDELRRNYNIPFGKDLAIAWEYATDLPSMATDDEKLKAVIQNLVNNAIKFTDRGVVTISVRHMAATNEIELKVADTGIGIPAEKIQTVFDMFQQVDSSATRKFGGVGLGLYIVRKYVDLLGGRVAVQSEFERGSTFIVHLPVSAGSAAARPADKTPSDDQPGSAASNVDGT